MHIINSNFDDRNDFYANNVLNCFDSFSEKLFFEFIV